MIAKKNSRYDLESKRSAFFQLGLFVTGSITLAAFSYSDPMMRADSGKDVERELIAVTWEPQEKQDDKPEVEITVPIDRVDEPQQTTVSGAELPDERSSETGNTNDPINPEVGVGSTGVPMGHVTTIGTGLVVISNDIFEMEVDKDAAFIGGFHEMQKYISSNINYPQEAIEFNEQGVVYTSFVVETDGSISNVTIERGVSKTLDREAKRIVKSFPEWIPGEIKMQKVRTRVRLPINFVLSN